MTTTRYADPESIAVAWLEADISGLNVGVETPADLAGSLDFVRLVRAGGPPVGVRLERATIVADYFAGTRAAAKDGASLVQWAFLHKAAGATVTLPNGSTGVIADTGCISGPASQPWGNPGIYRFGAVYTLTVQTV